MAGNLIVSHARTISLHRWDRASVAFLATWTSLRDKGVEKPLSRALINIIQASLPWIVTTAIAKLRHVSDDLASHDIGATDMLDPHRCATNLLPRRYHWHMIGRERSGFCFPGLPSVGILANGAATQKHSILHPTLHVPVLLCSVAVCVSCGRYILILIFVW